VNPLWASDVYRLGIGALFAELERDLERDLGHAPTPEEIAFDGRVYVAAGWTAGYGPALRPTEV